MGNSLLIFPKLNLPSHIFILVRYVCLNDRVNVVLGVRNKYIAAPNTVVLCE